MSSVTKENKKVNLKISKTLIIIGLILIILGIVFLSISIGTLKQNNVKYEQAYEQWYDAWWNDKTAGLNEKPQRESLPAMLPISIVIIVGGLSVLVFGLKPYITKLFLKHKKETLDYAGEEMTNIGNTMVDIGSPVINKAMDSVVVPTVSKIKGAVSDASKDKDEQIYCKHCGKLIGKDSKFCNKCGKEQ